MSNPCAPPRRGGDVYARLRLITPELREQENSTLATRPGEYKQDSGPVRLLRADLPIVCAAGGYQITKEDAKQ